MLERLKRFFGEEESESAAENHSALEGELVRSIEERERLISEQRGSMSIEEAYNAILDLNRRISSHPEQNKKIKKMI